MIDGVKKRSNIRGSLIPRVSYVQPRSLESDSGESTPSRKKSGEHLSFRPLSGEGGSGKYVALLVLIVAIGIVFFVIGWKTRSGVVTIVSPAQSIDLNKSISVRDKTTPGFLAVESMQLPFSYNPNATTQAPVVAEEAPKPVETSWYATGTIRIFNTTAKPINLRTQTRFQNPDGGLFYSQKAVTIKAGTVAKPGTTDVIIRSAQPVTKVSSSLDDFILPGLPVAQQKDIFARSTTALTRDSNQSADSATSAIATATPANPAAVLLTQTEGFKLWITKYFLPRVGTKIPAGFQVLSGSEHYDGLATNADGSTTGTATFTLVNSDEFSNFIKGEIASKKSIDKDYVILDSLEKVKGYLDSKNSQLTLTGPASFHIAAPKEILQSTIVGTQVSSFDKVMKGLTWVQSATLSVRPWWVPKLPTDPAKLKIQYTIGQ